MSAVADCWGEVDGLGNRGLRVEVFGDGRDMSALAGA